MPGIENKTVLELGCLDGKWSKYFFGKAKDVILVDLDKRIENILRKKFPQAKFLFYLTRGNELSGIATNSVDFIFSMDSLVRCPKSYIYLYIREFRRILTKNGKILVHLPCSDSINSRERRFVKISGKEIINCCNNEGFINSELDFDTIAHGCLLKVNYKKKDIY